VYRKSDDNPYECGRLVLANLPFTAHGEQHGDWSRSRPIAGRVVDRSILKRGITGTYHHVSRRHLKRYLVEFDFRYNTHAALDVDDATRADRLVRGIVGKRLTYRDSSVPAAAAE